MRTFYVVCNQNFRQHRIWKGFEKFRVLWLYIWFNLHLTIWKISLENFFSEYCILSKTSFSLSIKNSCTNPKHYNFIFQCPEERLYFPTALHGQREFLAQKTPTNTWNVTLFKLTHKPRPDEINVGRRKDFKDSASGLVGQYYPKTSRNRSHTVFQSEVGSPWRGVEWQEGCSPVAKSFNYKSLTMQSWFAYNYSKV